MYSAEKGILFDVDGTLWDASAEVAAAWNRALERFPEIKKRLTAADMRGLMGRTMADIFRSVAPEAGAERVEEIGAACCREEELGLRRHGGSLFPQERETLGFLAERYPLFIVSNCQSGYIETFLGASGFGKLFADFECFGNTGRLKSENIALLVRRNGLQKAVYVGDTRLDFESARDAGVPFVHASYGYGSVPEARRSVSAFALLAGVLPQVLG